MKKTVRMLIVASLLILPLLASGCVFHIHEHGHNHNHDNNDHGNRHHHGDDDGDD